MSFSITLVKDLGFYFLVFADQDRARMGQAFSIKNVQLADRLASFIRKKVKCQLGFF